MNQPIEGPFEKLEQSVHAALETYSNVHRGSGHSSMVSTHLFEKAREIILEYLGLSKSKYTVIFCTPRRAEVFKVKLSPKKYQCLSSQDIGLPLGIRALAVKKNALPKGPPLQSGGGTTRLISPGWVIWAHAPDKFEAGTPAIVNAIAFARALLLTGQFGKDIFHDPAVKKQTAGEILYQDELEKYSGRELLAELRKTLIGLNIHVPTREGDRPFINLDNSASTPTFTTIWNSVRQTWRQPGQSHQEIIQEVRSICAKTLGAPLADYDVIFTSNTTEAINLAAESLGLEPDQGTEPILINTLLEHSSNDLPWRMIPHSSIIRLLADDDGFLDLKELDSLLCAYNQESKYGKKRIRLVAVSGASNVLGTYNNLAEISRIVHRYGAHLLVDGAQMAAHRKVDIEETGIDYFAFSAHKVYAPFGTGVLMVKKGLLNFSPGEMELIRSSGEENAGGIAALGKALVLLQRIGIDLIREEEQVLTGRILRGLARVDGLQVYGINNPDSPGFHQKGGVIVFSLKGTMSNRVAKELAERRGIGVRYGCHCAHILVKHLVGVSPFLERFQWLILTLFPRLTLPGLVRVSLGIENSEEDIDTLILVVGKIARQTRASANRHPASTQNGTPNLPDADIRQQMNNFVRASALKVYAQSWWNRNN